MLWHVTGATQKHASASGAANAVPEIGDVEGQGSPLSSRWSLSRSRQRNIGEGIRLKSTSTERCLRVPAKYRCQLARSISRPHPPLLLGWIVETSAQCFFLRHPGDRNRAVATAHRSSR